MLDFLLMGRRRLTNEVAPAGRFVEIPGRGTTYVVDVAGPPGAPVVFLIHGLVASTYLNWFPAFGPLSAEFRVVAMDLPGHGRGMPLTQRKFRLADCADDIDAVARELELPPFIAVGYSLGGPIAQMLWRRHPGRVSGLVLAATSRNFMGTPQERLFFQGLVGIAGGVRLLPFVGRSDPAQPLPIDTDGTRMSSFALSELRRTSPNVLLQALSALGRFSSHDWVADIDVPTAVIVTAKDRAIGPHRQLKLANAIPGATVHPAKAGHTACVIGAKQFVPALVTACRSVQARIDGSPPH